MEQGKQYYAFISYKREDEKWAKWLQNKLEHYKFPTNLNGRTDLPKHIRPTFRDVTDLKPGLLVEEINNALCNSEWLIVVCSPRSAKSPWVCKEAQTFIDLGRADHIIPFVIEGNPFSNDYAECYPKALLSLTDSRELLATNINEMGCDAAAIKIVSRMFGLKFDTLWQRHERERRRKRKIWIGGALLFALVVALIALWINGMKDKIVLYHNKTIAQRALSLSERGEYVKACLEAAKVLYDVQQETDYPYFAEADAAIRKSTYALSYVIAEQEHFVSHISYSNDGRFFLSSSTLGGIELWDAHSDSVITRIGYKQCAVFNTQADKIAISHRKKDVNGIYPIEIRRLEGNRLNSLYLRAHTKDVTALAFSTDGHRLASVSSDGTLVVWNLETGAVMVKVQATPCIINTVAFSHDGRYIITAAGDNVFKKEIDHTAKVWDAETGKLLHTLDGHIASVTRALFSPNDECIVTSSEDKTIKIWDTNTYRLLYELDGHRGPVRSVSFSHDGMWLFSASDDRTVKWWDLSNGTLLLTLTGHSNAVYDISVSPEGDHLLSVSTDKTIRKWDLRTCKVPRDIISEPMLQSVAFNHDKSLVASICRDSLVRVWSTGTYKLLYAGKYVDDICSIDFGAKGEIVVSSYDTIMIWSLSSGKKTVRTLPGSFIGSVLYGTDDKWLLMASEDSLWIVNSSTMQKKTGIGFYLSSNPHACLGATKKNVAFSLMDNHIGMSNVKKLFSQKKTEVYIFETILPGEFANPILQIKFSPDEKHLAAISNHELKIWNTEEKEIIGETDVLELISSIDFCPNGRTMAITAGKSLLLMDVESQVIIDSIHITEPIVDASFDSNYSIIYVTLGGKMRKWTYPPLCDLLDETSLWLRRDRNRK